MTDNFERAMQGIVRSSAEPSIRDVLDAMVAANLDAEETAELLADQVKATADRLHSEVIAAAVDRQRDIDKVVARMEGYIAEHIEWTRTKSLPRLEAVEGAVADLSCIRGEHEAKHAEHLRSDHTHAPHRVDDPEGSDFGVNREDEEMRVSFRVGRWALAIVIPIIVSVLFTWYMIYRNMSNEVRIDKSDLHALIVVLKREHPSVAPSVTP